MADVRDSNIEDANVFDTGSLRAQLPPRNSNSSRRGLSRYFSGKSQSYTCLADVKSLEDLKKPEIPEAKRKKYSSREVSCLPPSSCRRAFSSNNCAPCIGA
ncbi:hypothetical protein MRB53_024345 [Persea americana]|uniref:Uncharacterized protein n=1 Tax=Persea americana TaxID=3435 RepID=A0ACC2LD42_PERAE|nr:hypothetical protein MRB53_024345 [Persea americana]